MNKIRICLAAALFLVLTAGLGIFFRYYTVVGLQVYPRDTVHLDLRGEEISISHHEALTEKLPQAQIRWEIPFRDGLLADDTQELTLSSLSVEEAEILAENLPRLRTVNGRECREFDGLLRLKELRPDVQVQYWVPIGGTGYASNALQIGMEDFTEEDIDRLQYLPNLRTVTLSGGEPELLDRLQALCARRNITIRLSIGGELIPQDAQVLEFHGLTDGEAAVLELLPELKRLHLSEPEAAPESLLRLRDALPDTAVTWEKTLLGKTFLHSAPEIDLTDIIALGANQQPGDETAYAKSLTYGIQGDPEEIPSSVKLMKHRPLPDKTALTEQIIEEVEAAMGYFPEARQLTMCGSILDNEAMAAFRQRNQEKYKVVWTVHCGKIATRTDATFFMPVKYHVYYLNNAEAANLRYCPELVAVDIGHMSVSDISFVEHLPQLRYLILAHTAVRDIEPLRSCKNLVFLEIDHTGVLDFSPLLDCSALEDLNIGKTWNDVEPLKEMTWLKNLWMVFRENSGPEMEEALPDTNVVYRGTATVDSGWRDLPNYFAMRDELKMFYMTW